MSLTGKQEAIKSRRDALASFRAHNEMLARHASSLEARGKAQKGDFKMLVMVIAYGLLIAVGVWAVIVAITK